MDDDPARLDHRLRAIEMRIESLEEQAVQGTDRVVRQWRYLRRYIGAWLREDSGPTEEERMNRQWRRLRKYLAVWMRED